MTAQVGDTLLSSARKKSLRDELRRRRAALAPSLRRRAVLRAAAHAARFVRHRRVALYLTRGSELDTAPLLQRLRGEVCVPQLTRRGMRFVTLAGARPVPSRRLDVVLLPLLGFDDRGTRLGQGGGHYDRALAFARIGRRPLFVGYAFEAQRCKALPHEPHDIRLDAVITEKGLQWLTG